MNEGCDLGRINRKMGMFLQFGEGLRSSLPPFSGSLEGIIQMRAGNCSQGFARNRGVLFFFPSGINEEIWEPIEAVPRAPSRSDCIRI